MIKNKFILSILLYFCLISVCFGVQFENGRVKISTDTASMFIDNSFGTSYLGIGTSSSNDKLTIFDGSIGSASMKISSLGNVGALSPYIKFETDGATFSQGTIEPFGAPYVCYYRISQATNLISNTRFQIDNNGDVAIGTTVSNGKLNVIGGSINCNYGIGVATMTTTSNVGIGTTSPSARLNVYLPSGEALRITGTGTGYTDQTYQTFYTGSSRKAYIGTYVYGNDLIINADAGNRIIFQNGVGIPLYISSGTTYTGVGIFPPTAQLDVAGSITSGRSLQLRSGEGSTDTDSTQIIFSYNNNSYDSNGYAHSIRTRHDAGSANNNAIDFWLWNYGTDTSSTLGSKRVVTMNGEGHVGIGTASPLQELDVNGNIINRGTFQFNSGDNSEWHLSLAGQDLDFTETGVADYRLYFKAGGNIGIGTDNPTSKLNVLNGDIRISTTTGSNGIYFQDTSLQTRAYAPVESSSHSASAVNISSLSDIYVSTITITQVGGKKLSIIGSIQVTADNIRTQTYSLYKGSSLLQSWTNGMGAGDNRVVPIMWFETSDAGAQTYTIRAKSNSSSGSQTVANYNWRVRED